MVKIKLWYLYVDYVTNSRLLYGIVKSVEDLEDQLIQ